MKKETLLVDLNSDLGEGQGQTISDVDRGIIGVITSANIACGAHAGNPDIMRDAVKCCIEHGTAIGAHPGFHDRENFGRTEMPVTPSEAYELVFSQSRALLEMAVAAGTKLHHVKPHGALYNMAGRDYNLALAIAKAVGDLKDLNGGQDVILLGLSGSQMQAAAEAEGIPFAGEVFADRAYNADATLVSRKLPGAVITEEKLVIERTVRMVREGVVTAIDGTEVSLRADSVCVHGDTAGALGLARALRASLTCDACQSTEQKASGGLEYEIFPLSDRAVTIVFGDDIKPEINDNVLRAQAAVEAAKLPAVVETVPTYCTLIVHYDRRQASYYEMRSALSEILNHLGEGTAETGGRHMEIPVCYDDIFAPDIDFVAEHAGLSKEEVIQIHTEPEYRVYMLGFLAGFPYLGGLDPRLESPRLESPRTKIEAGSVGIAGKQTGAYSIASPGGWQLIGCTPLKLYDPDRDEPALLRAGDLVKFKRISSAEFDRIENKKEQSWIRKARAGKKSKDEQVIPNAITVNNPGLFMTIQDQGRIGYQSQGVSVSGAMDRASAAMANMIAGNDYRVAVLECMMLGPSLEFNVDTVIAVAGAQAEIKINGQQAAEYTAIEVKRGDVLEIGPALQGMYIYIAVRGGIAVPKVLGSRSTHVRSGLGGLDGNKLIREDMLPIGSPEETTNVNQFAMSTGRSAVFRPVWKREMTIRVVPDRFENRFTEEGRKTFFSSEYTLSKACDRMGYRLSGPEVELTGGADIITDGVMMGSVQIPTNGQPIIMMADCQTTGGYVRIGNVLSEDLPKLAQCGPGCHLHFQEYSI